MLLVKCSLYLSSKLVGKFEGNDVVDTDLLKGLKEVRGFLVRGFREGF